MASFQAKMGWDSLRKRKKKLSFRSFTTRPGIKNSKKIEKSKNIIMSSFQGKMGREWLRNSEKKNYRSDQFVLDPE